MQTKRRALGATTGTEASISSSVSLWQWSVNSWEMTTASIKDASSLFRDLGRPPRAPFLRAHGCNSTLRAPISQMRSAIVWTELAVACHCVLKELATSLCGLTAKDLSAY